MNPARSLGPALAAGDWSHFWICVAGPVIGAVLGASACQAIRVPGLELSDPKGRPLEEVRATRDGIERRVAELLAEL
jgi:hypothetical protein